MASVAESLPNEPLRSASGELLKVSLRRSLRRQRLQALGLVAPLFIFILFTFMMPIADMLFRSVENQIVGDVLPKTVKALHDWNPDTQNLPPESVYAAMVADLKIARKERTASRVGQRLNYEHSGMSSLFRSTARKVRRMDAPPYKDALINANKKWGDPVSWKVIKQFSPAYTPGYFLAAVDATRTVDGDVHLLPEQERVYLPLFWRTLVLSAFITFMTFLLGFPISYLLATVPTRISNLLIIMVLLPFWTSLLVRTTAWIALLQKEGVINDLLVYVGVISDGSRLTMIHNATGTVIAMTHILLPFMVLPLYSVMKTISPSYVRAAQSLGATPSRAFWRIYFPQTVPGIGAGAILVFILAIGYYITPELVGGTSGTFISNRIAYNISSSLNWGLAAALGVLLLVIVLGMYILYDKVVGIDNMKLG